MSQEKQLVTQFMADGSHNEYTRRVLPRLVTSFNRSFDVIMDGGH